MVALLLWDAGAFDANPAQPTGSVGTIAPTVPPDRDVPITRFGGVPFEIQWPDGAEALMPDWTFEVYRVVRHIPGSNRNITQTLGKGPQTVTYRLELATRADLLDLKERVLETDTLVLYAAMTSATDNYQDVHGEGYVFIEDVELSGLGQPSIFLDGTVEVDATFQRPSPTP